MESEILRKYIAIHKKTPSENIIKFIESGKEFPLIYKNGQIKISKEGTR